MTLDPILAYLEFLRRKILQRNLALIILALFTITVPNLANPKVRVQDVRNGYENDYLIALQRRTPKEAVAGIARALSAQHDLELGQVWESLRSFRVLGPRGLVEDLAADPRVLIAEQNHRGYLTDRFSGDYSAWFNGDYRWAIDRLDEAAYNDRDSSYHMCHEGDDVTIYIMDTGIDYDHAELNGQVYTNLYNFTSDVNTNSADQCAGNSRAWHGTAVASLAGGKNIGSSRADLVGIKVAGCNDYGADADEFSSALDWMAGTTTLTEYNPYTQTSITYTNTHGYGIVVFSGFFPDWADDYAFINNAVSAFVDDTGYSFFTSADNFSSDSCKFAPNARAYTASNTSGEVFVVAGSNISGVQNDYTDYELRNWAVPLGQDFGTNLGNCISAFAPGGNVYSARHSPNSPSYGMASGTSFAAPLAAGIAARYAQYYKSINTVYPGPQTLYEWLRTQGTVVPDDSNTVVPAYTLCDVTYSYSRRELRGTTSGDCSSLTGGSAYPYNGVSASYVDDMPSVTNSTGATILYWDEGTCQ